MHKEFGLLENINLEDGKGKLVITLRWMLELKEYEMDETEPKSVARSPFILATLNLRFLLLQFNYNYIYTVFAKGFFVASYFATNRTCSFHLPHTEEREFCPV